MNINRLYEILTETTTQLRKGEVVEHHDLPGIEVTEIYAMPHTNEADAELVKVDLEFIVIGVDKIAADQRRDELMALLRDYPDPDRLAAGPSYIEVGGVIGDQGAAFQLFALGKVLGLWDVITPEKLGFDGAEAREMAGRGLIMITGLRP